MKDILFRAKRCDNGEWVQGFYVRADHHWHKHGIHKDWIICGASANGGWFALHNKYAVKGETVCQFTGLTDKNGRKIFEGDVLKSSCGYKATVELDSIIYAKLESLFNEDCEIIGNIYDK